jgi:raffinose/stachyose/melibiose transport system substrate-binding protein
MSRPGGGQPVSRRAFLAGGAATLGAVAFASAAAASPSLRTVSHLGAKHPSGVNETYSLYQYEAAPAPTILAQMVSDYNKATGNNLTVNINSLAGSGDILYEAKIRSLISEGSEPSFFQNWVHSLMIPYIEAGAVAPLTAWFKKYGWDKIIYANAVNYVTYKGAPYGVPLTVRGMPFWYRPSILKKAGVGLPTTFTEFENVLASVAKTGAAPIAVGEIYGWDLMRIFEYLLEVSVGPSVHDQLLNFETSWNSSGVADAFGLLQKWGDKKWLLPGFGGTNPNDADALFVAGRAAMDLTGGWEEASLQSGKVSEEDFDVFAGPTDHTPVRFSGFTEQWQISSKLTGSQMDALGDFMNWSIQPAQSRKYFAWLGGTATIGGLPAADFPINAKIFDLLEKHPTFIVMDQGLGQQIINVFFNLMDGVTKGSTTPQAAAAGMQAAVNKYGKAV